MVILETPTFTRLVTTLLDDLDYARLQGLLKVRPDAGALIAGTRGLRKLRWAPPGRGKRGGLRVIYYWAGSRGQLLMLFLYSKGATEALTRAQERALAAVAAREFG